MGYKMKVTELRDDQLIQLYIGLRDKRAKHKAEFDKADAPDRERMDKIEAIMLSRMIDSGAEAVRTNAGIAFKSTKSSANVADKEMYRQWLLADPDNRMHIAEIRVNKPAVEQYREVHQEVPPGINMNTEVTVIFRRP